MSDELDSDSWSPLSRVRGVPLLLRGLILAMPLTAAACTRFAADRPAPMIDLAIVGLAVVCVALPDSHVGLLVVLLVGAGWLVGVHDPATPWAIGTAASLTVFHAAMAAASAAPPAARWTQAMCRRWVRRSVSAMVPCVGTWAVVAALDGRYLTSSSALVTATLLALALAGMWARDGVLDAEPRRSA